MSRLPRIAVPARLGLLQEEKRSVTVAYLLWALACIPFGLPVGLCGAHRFYCRKPTSGALWLLTLGFCGVGQLIDLLLIPSMVRQANQPLLLQQALAALELGGGLSLEQHLLQLARQRGQAGFTLNDALLDAGLPAGCDSQQLRAEIERLLHADLLDVGNDERGRVIYREP